MMREFAVDPVEALRRASAVGSYYGFTSLATLRAAGKKGNSRTPYPDTLNLENLDPISREIAHVLKLSRDAGLVPTPHEPVFLWHTNVASGRPAPKNVLVHFHALGTERGIADAVVIRALRALASEIAKAEPMVKVNSLGDRETRDRYGRELAHFLRRHGDRFPPECHACARKEPFEALEIALKTGGVEPPSPTEHLSETSRKLFEGVLEYLEATNTPYELAPSLVRSGLWSETCFELSVDDKTLGWGARYTELARHFFKDIESAVVGVFKGSADGERKIPSVRDRSRPKVVFVHIGEEAKRESLRLAETFRTARLSLLQTVGVESLTEQMRLAEKINPPFLLIMGRKEALSGALVLRNRRTHEEETVLIPHLVERIRALA